MNTLVEDETATAAASSAPAARGDSGVRRAIDRHLHLQSPLLSFPAVAVILVGVLAPIGVLVVYSLWPTVDQQILHRWTLDNYARFFTDDNYWLSLVRSFVFVGLAAALTVGLTFPFAYFVATKVRPARRLLWVLLAVLPFFTSYLIRVFVWMNLLGDSGVLNHLLISSGLTDSPLSILGSNKSGIVITFIYMLFPLSFLTSYIAVERMNPAILEAAADLGARPWRRLIRVTLPIARTGLIAGFVFSFITMLGDYVTPQLIGGTEGYLYSNLITNQFGSSVQWGFGSALAMILMFAVFAMLVLMRVVSGGAQPVGAYTRAYTPTRAPVLAAYSWLFMLFLYAPIGLLVVLSFNDSPTIGFPFTGFTTQWFAEVFADDLLMSSLKTSLQVAGVAVGISVVIGTVAAVQLARSSGRWRTFSIGAIATPLFLPPMLLALAIIIGLNALGVDRGLWTIVLGHIVLTLPIVTLMVLIRLEGLDPNLELAALDLGATPFRALTRISIPQALPGIVAAALVAFATSMDEFILTSLVTGADTTLPLYIFGQLRFSVTPEIVAVSTLLLTASALLLVIGCGIAFIGRSKDAGAADVLNFTPAA
jgi:ABC-type spermidine/putrescine transport system permease subunit II